MAFTPKTWTDRPTVLDPNPAETVKDWLDRIAAYASAHPGVLTPLDAGGLIDLETRVTDYTDALEAAVAANLLAKAALASPTFTGTPEAPTPAPGDDSIRIATTAFVAAAVAAGGGGGGGGGGTSEAWQALSLGSNWAQHSGTYFGDAQAVSTLQYFMDAGGVVHLKGCAESQSGGYSTGAGGTGVIATLPSGRRPGEVIRFTAQFYDAGNFRAQLVLGYVLTDGSVVLQGTADGAQAISQSLGDLIFLDGIHFRAV